MLRPLERIFRKKMNKCDLFAFRLMNRLDGADQAIFQAGVLLLDKARQLGIGGRASQRQDQRFEHREDKGGHQTKPQHNNCPSGNAGRICKRKPDQERNHRHAQDPGQASKP